MRFQFLERLLPRSPFGDLFSFPGAPPLPGLETLALMEQREEPRPLPRGRRLVAQAQQGDEAAFESLYRQHSRRVYSLCLWMLGERTDAEDVTELAFLRTFRKIPTFASDAAFSNWLYRTSVELVLGRLRDDPSWGWSPERLPLAGEEPRPDHASPGPSGHLPVSRSALEKAVRNLPASNRMVFVLHDIFGYQDDDIAALLACGRESVKRQLHQARMLLRRLLREAVPDPQNATDHNREEQVR